MSIDKSTITKIAYLAQLAIPQDEIDNYTKELDRIIAFAQTINTVATTQIEPLSHVLDMTAHPGKEQTALRCDRITETAQRDTFQHIAPAVEEGYYIVSKVIE